MFETMSIKKITVGLFDDHPSVIKGIENELKDYQNNIELLFVANNKNDALEFVNRYAPQVLILDIISDDVSGLELFETIISNYPQCAIIAHSSLTSPSLVENLLYLGIKGYVSKKQTISDLVTAIIKVAQGEKYVPQNYAHLASQYKSPTNSILTEREIEIISLISDGHRSSKIAEQLNLSENTIESHRTRIFNKLNVKNVAQMVREATKLGYLR
jgi:DNA-binding NarL/FixJ family response regulator